MKKTFLTVIALFYSTFIFSQLVYEKGFYINNDDQKIEGLILVTKWPSNPDKIIFKKNSDTTSKEIPAESIKSFTIPNKYKFVKKEVLIDISNEELSSLSNSKEPILQKKTSLLEVLVEGKANLYYYKDSKNHSYLFNIDDGKINELTYKEYIKDDKVLANNSFKQQLYNVFKGCNSFSLESFNNLKYNKRSLTKYFIAYNDCTNNSSKIFSKGEKLNLNLRVNGGINYFSVDFAPNSSYFFLGKDFGSIIRYQFGLEGEVVFPSVKNQIGVFGGLIKKSNYDEERNVDLPEFFDDETQKVRVTLNSLELPVGARYYFGINEYSSFTVLGGTVFELVNEATLTQSNVGGKFDIEDNDISFFLGIGYHYSKFYTQLTVDLGKGTLTDEKTGFSSNISSINLILGYTIF